MLVWIALSLNVGLYMGTNVIFIHRASRRHSLKSKCPFHRMLVLTETFIDSFRKAFVEIKMSTKCAINLIIIECWSSQCEFHMGKCWIISIPCKIGYPIYCQFIHQKKAHFKVISMYHYIKMLSLYIETAFVETQMSIP